MEEPARGAGDPAGENLLIEGDNLLALKALLPRFAGQVKSGLYLLYNGILRDKTPDGGNVLTRRVLETLSLPADFQGQRVVYGTACRLSAAHLHQANLVFRQIPYEGAHPLIL